MSNIKIGHNYIISKPYNSTENSDNHFNKHDIVEIQDIDQNNCLVKRINDEYVGWLPIDFLYSNHIDKLLIPKRNHYSLACHLNPRLSESNFNFHDIFWRDNCNMMRKRDVKLSKFVKIHSIINRKKEKQKVQYMVECFLYDCGSKAGRQTVSNIHTVFINSINNKNNFFSLKSDYPTFLLRSNYNQSEVVLKLNIIEISKNQNNENIYEFLGSILINLLDSENNVIFSNKTMNYNITNNNNQTNEKSDIIIKISAFNVPIGQKNDVDILPDVIICKTEHISLFCIFRNICGYQLFNSRENTDKDYVYDDFIAKFLEIVDSEDVVNYLHILCLKYGVYKAKDQSYQLLKIFKKYILPLTICYGIKEDIVIDEDLSNQISSKNTHLVKMDILNDYDTKNDFDPIHFLSNQKCKPVNLRQCTFQLCNVHSLD
uniref:SH3 domain-containing protein n=1 Tax=Strongyloides stercoralis TaxID=6248 RepID=A0A0K0EG51_STRER